MYAGGASEREAKGFCTVGGFAGRRVGLLKAANGDLAESIGEVAFDAFDDLDDIVDDVLLNLLDFLRKILREGICLGEWLSRCAENSEDGVRWMRIDIAKVE